MGDGALVTLDDRTRAEARLRTVTTLPDPVNKRGLGLFPRAAKQHFAA